MVSKSSTVLNPTSLRLQDDPVERERVRALDQARRALGLSSASVPTASMQVASLTPFARFRLRASPFSCVLQHGKFFEPPFGDPRAPLRSKVDGIA